MKNISNIERAGGKPKIANSYANIVSLDAVVLI